MRYGIVFVLALWTATGLARGQAPYPGPGGPGPMPPPGWFNPGYPSGGMPYPPGGYPYPPSGYPYPQPYYRPPGMVAGPYNPYPTPVLMPPPANPLAREAMPDNPGLPVPSVPSLPVAPQEPCEPMVISKVGPPACAGACGSCPPSWTDCVQRPNQAPGGYCFYGRVEVLYWWLQNQSVSGLNNTGNISAGTVSVPGFSYDVTNAVPDYKYITDANHLGLRFTNGVWLDEANTWAIEGSVFGTLESPTPYYATGGPTAAATPAAIASLASLLGLSTAQAGSLLAGLSGNNVVALAGFFAGGELNLRHEICRSEYGHIDWLLGARILELVEYGGVADTFGGVVVGTQNQFIGGQVGLEGELSHGRWFLDGVGKVALGSNHEIVSVGTTTTGSGSISSLLGNQGVQNRDVFATMGEVGLSVGVRLGCNTRLFANYTLIYLTDAVRPLPQIAPYLGGATPAFSFMSSSFWAQGVSLGLEYRF